MSINLEEIKSAAEKVKSYVSSTDVVRLKELMDSALNIEQEISEIEELLKAKREDYRKITEEQLPSAMQELSISEFKFGTGFKITLDDVVHAKIPAHHEAKAFSWLEENGYGHIIKNVVSVSFGSGEDEIAAQLEEYIGSNEQLKDIPHERKMNVHPSTLKSWVKERLEKHDAFPMDIFGVFQRTVAKIKKPKASII